MMYAPDAPPFPLWRDRLAEISTEEEDALIGQLVAETTFPDDALRRVEETARRITKAIRKRPTTGPDALLLEYGLSQPEGLALMRLVEALPRVPDPSVAEALIVDKMTGVDWSKRRGRSRSIFVNTATTGLALGTWVLSPADNLWHRFTARVGRVLMRVALQKAVAMMSRTFVLGETMDQALRRARRSERRGYLHSYDMLGEAARTAQDARAYHAAYENAISSVKADPDSTDDTGRPSVSVKLSALHPRYESARREQMLGVMVERVLSLAHLAKSRGVDICIDAEETERLELSLEIIERVYDNPSLEGWTGFGIAVQAYQKRARRTIDIVADMVKRVGRRMNVRLVKGAYWDSEIKRAQELGLDDYPVFTRKAATDVSYLACAKALLAHSDLFHPQFATHNAHTVASILEMAQGRPLEFQRLHGMGEALYNHLIKEHAARCRIYAPVGDRKRLLPYLARRLLENGANTSFVNRIADESVPIKDIIADPGQRLATAPRTHSILKPANLYRDTRCNSRGVDLADSAARAALATEMATVGEQRWTSGPIISGAERSGDGRCVRNPANVDDVVGTVVDATPEAIEDALSCASAAQTAWAARAVGERTELIEAVADLMEEHMGVLLSLLGREAGKTLADGVAEVREAIDFLRYYAHRAHSLLSGARPRGIFLCISPWNFPLAIFTGQLAAALAAGNAAIAKPAEQTPLIAAEAIRLFLEAGIPADILALLPGDGKTVGAALARDPRVAGVAFTGSLEAAKDIARALAETARASVPLIAETGGLNAMIVDSSALPEQVTRDVVISAFGSAGQRCSALRVLYVQDDIADPIIDMIRGAVDELRVGDPAQLRTDIGPVIDEDARTRLDAHARRMDQEAAPLAVCALSNDCETGIFFAPRVYEVEAISHVGQEVFGPILHIIRYKTEHLDAVLHDIRATGYGLTMGIHTRIDARARYIFERSAIGNTYVNRNQTGAVVGVNPFGGEGLSGTGPKAGGPRYLPRFTTVTDPSLPIRATVQPKATTAAVGDANTVARALDAASAEQSTWEVRTPEERTCLLLGMARALEPELAGMLERDAGMLRKDAAAEVRVARDTVTRIAETAPGRLAAQRLLGPTGEFNELSFHPKGVLLHLALSGGSFATALSHLAAALAAGNTLALATDPVFYTAVRRVVVEAGIVPLVPVIAVSTDTATLAARTLSVAGVAMTAAHEEMRRISVELFTRPGAIITLVTDPPGPYLLDRFVIERTMTIDTTSAGGNVTLMTCGDAANGRREP